MFELDRGSSRSLPEPDLVPILDGLTCVIFFLLLSISFIGLTKLTLPPSASTVVSAGVEKLPVSPKIKVRREGNQLSVELEWMSLRQESAKFIYPRDESKKVHRELIQKVSELVFSFKEKFPAEKTMQLVLSPDLNYQEMISVMDGIRLHIEDIVLNSYKELE
ncbi:MAG: biopolymer transporter ExbD [Bdellovibrionaceae bacterium]|nr:biopolymer transporter ExbD [Pseudobdellovibrionaceae bacterium]